MTDASHRLFDEIVTTRDAAARWEMVPVTSDGNMARGRLGTLRRLARSEKYPADRSSGAVARLIDVTTFVGDIALIEKDHLVGISALRAEKIAVGVDDPDLQKQRGILLNLKIMERYECRRRQR